MNTLLIISLIQLVAIEVLYEGHFGDKHDKASALRLAGTFAFAAILGLMIGQWQSMFTYFFVRVALFDMAFGGLFRGSIFYLGSNFTDTIQKNFPHWLRVAIWGYSFIIALLLNYKL